MSGDLRGGIITKNHQHSIGQDLYRGGCAGASARALPSLTEGKMVFMPSSSARRGSVARVGHRIAQTDIARAGSDLFKISAPARQANAGMEEKPYVA